MRILVIGSGGREHALCWKLNESPRVEKIFCAPGNGGTSAIATNVEIDLDRHEDVVTFCVDNKIDLAVVGPEAPLAVGMADHFERAGIPVFGPGFAGARLESSKVFAKEFMGRYDIPTATFRIFDDIAKAKEHIIEFGKPVVVKAYGLAAGKGVVVARDEEEALKAAEDMLVKKVFGAAGSMIVVEECLEGEEVSILVVTDGEKVIPLASSQDHKRVGEGDTGPNTGGMGAYSPAPVIDEDMMETIMGSIINPTIEGLRNDKIAYKGVLYAGLMMTKDGPKVLEYNVRFGDPETQAILPRMRSDLAELLYAAAKGDLSGIEVEWDDEDCVCVVLASGGYPGKYVPGKAITGIKEAEKEGAIVFHAGTRSENGMVVTSGGRVLDVVAKGKGIKKAIDGVYRAVSRIGFEGMHYRKDIAYRAAGRAR
ncbi:MAG: phosphoribosylamine--glycine ligase [Candidatus Omnitrophica bacterium]|nr:phosphoribosylamine--glycine ligase [Candidatus Omnitrophota bacterium]MDD5488178.1 phosphoribosylamine--glycine ligase [Candidatus Omnitrophota bacterium]